MGSLGPESCDAAGGEEGWEVLWCAEHAWQVPADMLEAMLPPWARLKRRDRSRPLVEQVSDATRVLIPTTALVDAEVIAACPRLRLIAQPAAGTANIDIEAAKARGVPVTFAPGCNDHSTAEVALLLMLMLSRRAAEAQAAFAACHEVGEPAGRELYRKTLGIVGMGRVGSCLAAAAEGLGMQVISTNSRSSRQELEQLLREADVVSLHAQLNPSTHGLIGAAELALMKPRALLINTGRGALLDKAALLQALEAGRLGGVGLDTHWVEPADPAEPLYARFGSKVLSLPHVGCASEEAYQRLARVLCENIVRVREGRELLHRLA